MSRPRVKDPKVVLAVRISRLAKRELKFQARAESKRTGTTVTPSSYGGEIIERHVRSVNGVSQ